jgi:hypothetical protein
MDTEIKRKLASGFVNAHQNLKLKHPPAEFQRKMNHWVRVVRARSRDFADNELKAIEVLVQEHQNSDDSLWVAATGAHFAMLKRIGNLQELPAIDSKGHVQVKELRRFLEAIKEAAFLLREIFPAEFDRRVAGYVDMINSHVNQFGGDPFKSVYVLLPYKQFCSDSKPWFYAALMIIARQELEEKSHSQEEECDCRDCRVKKMEAVRR